MAPNGKRKGGNYERKVAKELSTWMFGESKVLFRHASSGARKVVYSGDIVPEDELINYGWKTWPFIIELKDGYKEHTPTFAKQTQLQKWLSKLLSEATEKQFCPIFIWQIYRSSAIFLTTECLNIKWNLCYNFITEEYGDVYFYCYLYKDLLNYNFEDIFPLKILEVIYNGEVKI